MNLPFVSRARFDDREREILELRRELADLKYEHKRVLDEINFRSTGFHLYERFEKKTEAQAQPAPVVRPESEASTPKTLLTEAVDAVGRRPSAIRNYMETRALAKSQENDQQFVDEAEARRVAAQLEAAMHLADERAASAKAAEA